MNTQTTRATTQDHVQVFDLHCDTLDRLGWQLLDDDLRNTQKAYVDEDARYVAPGELMDFNNERTHLALQRTQGLNWAQCLAVFIPDPFTPEQSTRFFDTIAQTLPAHCSAHPEHLAHLKTVNEIETIFEQGKLAGFLTIENGKLLAARPDMLDHIADFGVKMVTLTWNAANPLGSGNQTQQGLTDFGKKMVAGLEARKIAVDVSHLNDPGFWDVVAYAKRPFAASHSNARSVCSHPRNLTDEQFCALRDAGGVVGLNFCRDFVSTTADPTPEELFAHVDHWLDLDGADTVALGTDYDGCDVPSWLDGCETIASFAEMLYARYGEELAHKLLFANAFDFFRRIEVD